MWTILHQDKFEERAMSKVLEQMTYEQYQAMQQKWLQSGTMLWFIAGNVLPSVATEIVEQALGALKLRGVPREEIPDIRNLDIRVDG